MRLITRSLAIGLCALLPATLSAETRVPVSQAEISLGFAPLVKEAAPAVVNIYAKRIVQARAVSPFASDPFFGRLFQDLGRPQPRVQNSLGSGVILSEDGFVVSNHHVVGEATDIRVVLSDRREFAAQVVLADEQADLAILKLEGAEGMPHLALRDSASVEVGELVLAIGNPFGVGQTVSSGIVSGLARSGAATGSARGYFIQTDAPINPGNSGGALIDVNGDLIGVNTSILTRSGGSNGIGFAIPSALVAQFLKQAREGQTSFQRPWAGLEGQAVDGDLAEGLGLSVPEGILVSDVHPQSPFAEAGVRQGDVILSVDGLPVNSGPEMIYRMSVAGLGETSLISVLRAGERLDLTVPLIRAPDMPDRAARVLGERDVLPGLALARINPAVGEELGLPLRAEGVVVTEPGPVAVRIGLRMGDVILAVNGARVETPADVARALRAVGRTVDLQVIRSGQRVSLRFRL
ncbi:Periplasmic pH-dependent serine endoprotease DegQ precursor [Pseudoruegeria aquimaris]|uniref:Periplasmic pH-dependent serine endoprotease DegQ n=1 Tax=Pseudoruegeria aquimaris TaxID=393663 RepID=A0A1Y5SDR9_9RHOB|nr:trypsin-like peptidase domain-containing protein [Pseudoruegeria aquimaris]SLN38275.1 Periplasmic pH-dependent serine endoprotease DegQ precursor [Pseudoruegeria aquimaris]